MNFKKILVKAPTTLTGNYEVLDETRYILNNAFKSVDVDQVIWDEKTTDEIKQTMTYREWGLSSGDIISASNWFIIIDPTDEKYFTYTNINEYIIINGLNSGYPQHIKLPSLIDGKPVVGIDDSAFKDSNLTAINFHHGLSSIFMGSGLFENCTGLSSFKVPECIDRIKDNMFKGCSNLTSLELHDNILEFGDHAFDGCSKLTSIINNIPDTLTSLGDYVFGNFNFTEIHLPGSLTNIGASAFTNNENVSMVYMEQHSIASILANPNYPFGLKDDTNISCLDGTIFVNKGVFYTRHDPEYCNGYLTAITEPNKQNCITGFNFEYFTNSETEISSTILIPLYVLDNEVYGVSCDHYHDKLEKDIAENNADYSGLYGQILLNSISAISVEYGLKFIDFTFFNYNRISAISLPNTLTSIGRFTFFGCNKISSIDLPSSLVSIGNYAFSNCSRLQNITIPQNITTIPDYLFNNCTQLTSITLPESITNINEGAFKNCSFIKNIELPQNVNIIKDNVFENCTSLLSITIPENVNTLGLSIFNGCSELSNIVFNTSKLSSLNEYIFSNCKKLVSITLPTSLTSIKSYTFNNCSSLKNVNLPTNVTELNEYAFNNCYSVSSISLPTSLTSIQSYTFNNCSSLLNINLPANITELNEYAFNNCYSLSNVIINNTSIDKLNQYTFNNCSSLTSITLPITLTSIQSYTFNKCTLLKNINISDLINLSTINSYTFNDCYQLTNIILPESILDINGFAFNNCSSLTSITIPESVSSIEEFAFVNCNNITEIIFKNKTIDDVSSMANYINWKIGYKYVNNIENQVKSISSEQRGTDCVLKVYYNAKQHLTKYEEGFQYFEAKSEDDSTAVLTGFNFSEQSLNTINDIGTLIIPSTLNNKTIESIINPKVSSLVNMQDCSYDLNFKYDNINTFLNLDTISYSAYNFQFPAGYTDFKLSAVTHSYRDTFYEIVREFFRTYNANKYTNKLMYLSFVNTKSSDGFYYSSGVQLKPKNPNIMGRYVDKDRNYNPPVTFESFLDWEDSYNLNNVYKNYIGIHKTPLNLLSNKIINLSIEDGIKHISPPLDINGLKNWSFNEISNNYFTDESKISNNTIFKYFNTKYFSSLLSDYVLYLDSDNIYNSQIVYNLGGFDNLYRPNIQRCRFSRSHYTRLTFANGMSYSEIANTFLKRHYPSCSSLNEARDKFGSWDVNRTYDIYREDLEDECDKLEWTGYAYFYSPLLTNRCCGYSTFLRDISLPSTLTYIGNYAFYNSHCHNINISDCTNLKFIGSNAFTNFGIGNAGYGSAVVDIQLPDSLEILDLSAFNIFSFYKHPYPKYTSNHIMSYAAGKKYNTQKHNVRLGNNLKYIGTGSLDGFNTISSGQFWYENLEDKKMICGTTVDWINSITIPDSVLYIKEKSFIKCKLLSNITFHNNIRWIGAYALSGCNKLSSVTLPNNLEYLDTGIFKDCTSLTSVNLNNVKAIGSNVFHGCTNLTSINIPETVNTIMDYAFNGSGIKTLTIPDSVETLGINFISDISSLTFGSNSKLRYISPSMFRENTKLQQINIPDEVTTIGNLAFYNCSSLTSISINSNSKLKTINNKAFNGCINISTFNMPNNVETIGDNAFYNCSSLTSISLPETLSNLGLCAFANCYHLSNVQMSNNVKHIKEQAFYKCLSLTSINIPTGLTALDTSAFMECTSLISIELPNTLSTIKQYTFSRCRSLSTVIIPSSISTISEYAFVNSGLKSIEIPPFVSTIKKCTFSNCKELTSISINPKLQLIEQSAFNGCSNLNKVNVTNISAWFNINFYDKTANPLYYAKNFYLNNKLVTELTIPNNITSIPYYQFIECESITNIVIPESVKTIGSYAFYGCTNLVSLTIPENITKISSYAFAYCSSLTSINIQSKYANLNINSNTFLSTNNVKHLTADCLPTGLNIKNLLTITIPDNCTSIRSRGFYNSSYGLNLEEITIPSTVTFIGDSAFRYSKSIQRVNITDISSWCKINFDSLESNPMKYSKNLCINGEPLTSIVIPTDITKLHDTVFMNCTSVSNITIPFSITELGINIFTGCSSLTCVAFADRTIDDLYTLLINSYGNITSPAQLSAKLGIELNKLSCTDGWFSV